MTLLQKLIKQSNRLIEAPYNKLNLSNYKSKIVNSYSLKSFEFINTYSQAPIKLMSNQDINAGIIASATKSNKKRTIYLIGKGILFDAGGYDLKPSGRMNDMKTDMSGMSIAFAVASYFKNDNIIAYCPVSVNLIPNGITPGDYIKIGKKEVEITNTDAEGRLILAEALSHLPVKKNDIVITVATLTGCCSRAVGNKATGVMTLNDELACQYKEASRQAGELSWRLPLWDYLQKKYYDKKRIQNAINAIDAGATEGGLFVKQFVKYPKNWIHLDIAPSAFDEKKNQATGEPIKTLINFVKELNNA